MRLSIDSHRKKEVIDITDRLNELIRNENKTDGFCMLFIKHTTAAITTADLDPGGTDLDYADAFEALMPKLHYRHPHNPKHVTDHILSSIIGPSLVIPIIDGELDLGTWQRVIVVELDGPRHRDLTVKFFA